MTHYGIRHSFDTTFIIGEVQNLRTKWNVPWNSGELNEVPVHKKTIEQILKDKSVAGWVFFLENSSLLERSSCTDLYSMLTFEALQNLLLEDSKMIKYCMTQYISSSTLSLTFTDRGSKYSLISSIKKSMLRVCNTVQSEFQKYYVMNGIKLDLSDHECSS